MMNRRNFLKRSAYAAGALALTGSVSAGLSCTTSPKKKANFVFILIDDMGWPDPGCYGHPFHETPAMDRLAAEGMRFTDAYAACPVCSPTRASIYSGHYPAHIGLTDFIPGHWRPFAKLRVPRNEPQHLPLAAVTIAEALHPAGTISGLFGKWHCGFGKAYAPDKQGFDPMLVLSGFRHFQNDSYPDLHLGQDDYFAEVVTNQAVTFLEQNKEKPFLLFVDHFAVHIPLQARKKLIEKYENKPKPATGVNNPVYAAMVEHVDQSIGRIVAKLDELHLAENTVVVVFSDNGGLRQRFDGVGEIVSTNAPLRGEKGTLYEGGIRVPLVIRWPGKVKPGSVCSEPVTSVDFYPTFLDIAGVEGDPDYALDGKSLTPLLTQKGDFDRQAIYWHYPHYHHSVPAGAIRAGDWKLIEFYDDAHLELYNLAKDIGEKNNLADKMPQKASELQQKLAAWRTSVGAKMPTPNPDYDPERAGEWGRHPDLAEIIKSIQSMKGK